MGAYTALHVGMVAPQRCLSVVAAGCGWGSLPDPKQSDAMKAFAAETGKMFAEEGIVAAPPENADPPMPPGPKKKEPPGRAQIRPLRTQTSATRPPHTHVRRHPKRP